MFVAKTLQGPQLEEARRQYEADGATVVRNVIDSAWIETLKAGMERLLGENSPGAAEFAAQGRFFSESYAYLRSTELRDFVFKSGIAELAGAIMRSKEVRFYYDQVFSKEPGTPTRTPWHHDTAYWPFSGDHVISIWVPLDAATSENGVLSYVKGSHRWRAFYPVDNWSDKDAMPEMMRDDRAEDPGPGASAKQQRTIGDISAHPENYQFCTWEVQPGDVLVHHKDTIHGAPGNSTQSQRRRAIAFRFLGDDARWDDSRAKIFKSLRQIPNFPYPDHLQTGDPISGEIFPVLRGA